MTVWSNGGTKDRAAGTVLPIRRQWEAMKPRASTRNRGAPVVARAPTQRQR